MKRSPLLKRIVSILLIALGAAGCARQPAEPPAPTVLPGPTASPTPAPTPTPSPDAAMTKQAFIDSLLADMTTEEMVGQVFMLACRNDEGGNPVRSASQGFGALVTAYKLGGVILFSENIDTVEQTTGLIADLQAASPIPLFVAVDEEGGKVSRVGANPKMGATQFPPMAQVGAAGDPSLARDVGRVIAAELRALGFNMDMAPVADVHTNPKNPVIGDRAFSGDPQVAAGMVSAFVTGMQGEGVAAVVKHFPGHGDTDADTHTGAVSVTHDLDRLRAVELVPFAAGIDAGAYGVMTAHIQVPHVTGDDTPATLSPAILTDLLRDEMGFSGLILADALEMKAITGRYGSGEACVQSFLAGADILLMPASPQEACQGMLAAVEEGVISRERLLESVARILSVKYDLGLFSGEPLPDPHSVLGSEEHLAVARAVNEAAGMPGKSPLP